MKVGQDVRLFDAAGETHTARVVEITGASEHHFKILTLAYRAGGEDLTLEGVHYETDAAQGEPFWLLPGERRSRLPADEAAAEPLETLDTQAFPDTTDAAPPSESTTTPKRRR